MLRLNRVAAAVACAHDVRAATDITGFGLLGHALEMIEASMAGMAISASALPLLPGARALAEAGHFSGGARRNRRHVESVLGARLEVDPAVPDVVVAMAAEAETSGGLLFAVDAARARSVPGAFRERGEDVWEIGRVLADPVLRLGP